MARRTTEFTVTTEGSRDYGRRFKLTEMHSDQAERWAFRLFLALANAGARLPEGVMEGGMQALAAYIPKVMLQGIRALEGLHYEDVSKLYDEIMTCVQYIPDDPNIPPKMILGGINCQIEEVQTRVQLRLEVIALHLNFSLADVLQTMAKPATSPTPA